MPLLCQVEARSGSQEAQGHVDRNSLLLDFHRPLPPSRTSIVVKGTGVLPNRDIPVCAGIVGAKCG